MLDCVACKEKRSIILYYFTYFYIILYDFINYPAFVKFFRGYFRQAFKKVVAGCIRQVVVLHSNNCMGICMGGLSIGCLRQVVILQRWLFEQV